MKTISKKVGTIILVILAFFVLFTYARLDPAEYAFPKCPFLLATGLKCPGCGSQRALHRLLNLDFSAAFGYNACLVVFIPILLFLLGATLLRHRFPKLHSFSRSPIVLWSLPSLILLWWILRNIFGW